MKVGLLFFCKILQKLKVGGERGVTKDACVMDISSSWMNWFHSLVSHKALSSAVFSPLLLLFIEFCYHFVFNVPPGFLFMLFYGLVVYDLLFVCKKKKKKNLKCVV